MKLWVNEASFVKKKKHNLNKASKTFGTYFFILFFVFSPFYLDLIINSMVSTTLTSVFEYVIIYCIKRTFIIYILYAIL